MYFLKVFIVALKRSLVYSRLNSCVLFVVILICSEACLCFAKSSRIAKRSQHVKNSVYGHHGKDDTHERMDSKFDFNFKWDDEPPEFISQLDLEVKWDDGEGGTESTPSRVSIHNVTMDRDYDITHPMTHLITKVANKSVHERQNNPTTMSPKISTELPDKVTVPADVSEPSSAPPVYHSDPVTTTIATTTTTSRSCSCEDIDSLIKSVQIKPKRGRRGLKGTKGDRGIPGLSVVGQKGEPGHPGMLPFHLLHPENLKGERGEKGERGPPGECRPEDNSTPLGPSNIQRESSRNQVAKPNYRIVPGALVFKTVPAMVQMSTYVMLGSVAFVEGSDEFYGKVAKGWRRFQTEPLDS